MVLYERRLFDHVLRAKTNNISTVHQSKLQRKENVNSRGEAFHKITD